MILDNPIIHDQRIQSLGMKFNSIVQQNNLVIQATCQGDNSQYTGKVALNPDLSFDQIVQHLDARTFAIISKNQDVLRLEIMHREVELYSMLKLQLNELKQQIRALNQRQNGFELMMNAQIDQLNVFKDQTNQFKLQIKNQIKDIMIEQIKKIKVDQLKQEMTRIKTQVNEHFVKLQQHSNQIEQTSIRMSQQSEKLNQYKSQLKYLISCLQSKLNCQLTFESSWQISRLNEPIRSSCNWSEQLKSKFIKINNNVVALKKWTSQLEFCLLNSSFSKQLKSKQSWAIQINTMTTLICLGVCLKSKMNNIFNGKNMKLRETGHGLYMICSNSGCMSHSQEEFNNLMKSFEFGSGDVIFIEYDPIGSKLRFSKNKGENYFELSIIAPPQNDAYHPFVSLKGKNNSVQLLSPPN